MSAHSELQGAVLDFLNQLPNCKAYDTPTTRGVGKRRKSGSKGKSDVVCCYRGIYIAIEIKVPPDPQREAQKDFEKDIVGALGFYWIITSVEELHAKMINIVKGE